MRITIQILLKEGSYNKLISICDGSLNTAFKNVASLITVPHFERTYITASGKNDTAKRFQKVQKLVYQKKPAAPFEDREIGMSPAPCYEHLQTLIDRHLNRPSMSSAKGTRRIQLSSTPPSRRRFESCQQPCLIAGDSGSHMHGNREYFEKRLNKISLKESNGKRHQLIQPKLS